MKLSSKKIKKYSSDEITGNAGLTPGAPRDIMKPKDADVKMEKRPHTEEGSMDPKEICERIDLASEIQSEVLGADLRIPDELAARMISTDTADEAYGEIEKLCDPEKHGFDMLACMLIIVCLEDRNSVNFRGA